MFAEFLLKVLQNKRIFLLYGELGTGKTTFIKKLFYNNDITSPTFNSYNIYKAILPNYLQFNGEIFHFDFYIKKPEQIVLLHSLNGPQLVFIEWPDEQQIFKYFESEIVKLQFSKSFDVKLFTT